MARSRVLGLLSGQSLTRSEINCPEPAHVSFQDQNQLRTPLDANYVPVPLVGPTAATLSAGDGVEWLLCAS